jgi:hypothetical protein
MSESDRLGFASKAGVREGKKEIIQISIEDVRDLRKDLTDDLSARNSVLDQRHEQSRAKSKGN